jgi:hypothetical protein
VDGGQRTLVARVHRLQHIEGLFTAHIGGDHTADEKQDISCGAARCTGESSQIQLPKHFAVKLRLHPLVFVQMAMKESSLAPASKLC